MIVTMCVIEIYIVIIISYNLDAIYKQEIFTNIPFHCSAQILTKVQYQLMSGVLDSERSAFFTISLLKVG